MKTKFMTHYLWPLRVAGAGLLIATAAEHLDLYLTGFRTIPVIGWLFLLQVIVAFALALAVLAAPLLRSWLPAAVAGAGAAFALSTLGASLLSLWVGLFGFRDVRTTAGIVAGVIEIAAFCALALLGVASLQAASAVPAHATPTATRVPAARRGPPGEPSVPLDSQATVGRTPQDAPWAARLRWIAPSAIAGLTVVALAVFGVSEVTANGATSSSPSTGTRVVLRTAQVGGVTVLTDSEGLTLYWFAPDKPTSSACYGTCAAYWPPVSGTPVVAAGVTGVTGTLGTIRRTDGSVQATYDSHPLYTYIGDTRPGQASGNKVDLNGGFWYDMPIKG
jgi:predicted lipoprotein with Yx(FWY)xxD motif